MLPNGNGLVVGGDNVDLSDPFLTNGFFSVRIIDPFGQTNTLAPNMPTGRWYPTLLTMPDGTIFIAGGVQVSSPRATHRSQVTTVQIMTSFKSSNHMLTSTRIFEKWLGAIGRPAG